MLIKSIGIADKKGVFNTLVRYVWADKGKANEENSFSYFHNISRFDPNGIAKEFRENDFHRKKRKGGLALHHIVLSFSPFDSDSLTHEVLHDLVTKFIELRGNEGLYFGRLHSSKDHVHVHILMSANKYRSAQSMRMSRNEFQELKQDIETYQLEKFPEISHSIVQLEREIDVFEIEM